MDGLGQNCDVGKLQQYFSLTIAIELQPSTSHVKCIKHIQTNSRGFTWNSQSSLSSTLLKVAKTIFILVLINNKKNLQRTNESHCLQENHL